MTRNKPVRHRVVTYIRKGHLVRSYIRGSGTKVVKTKMPTTRHLRPEIVAEYIGTIGSIQNFPKYKGYKLVTDSQDVKEIWDSFGNDSTIKDFNGFLVKVGEGEYNDVLGFPGSVPHFYKRLYRIVKKY